MTDRLPEALAAEVGAAAAARAARADSIEARADALAEAGEQIARRVRDGARLWAVGAGTTATDADHIAVEFVHPVIAGARSVPAVAITCDAADGPLAERLSLFVRSGDVVIGVVAGGDPAVVGALQVAMQAGALCVVLAPDGLPRARGIDLVVPLGPVHDDTAAEDRVSAYHVLWELVQVFLEEEPGLEPH
jgi:D-sedoheptulose 7-phosphate isomerase